MMSDADSFNPRAREGRDAAVTAAKAVDSVVSIHAPAKGATRALVIWWAQPRSFNPRAREGRDQLAKLMLNNIYGFQSTRPRRARRFAGRSGAWFNSFQSTRPRRARLLGEAGVHRRTAVSIHAPAKGATGRSRSSCRRTWSFNPRAREGRDPRNASHARGKTGFNPRAREGRDSLVSSPLAPFTGFQSTRPRRARPQSSGHSISQFTVSIHAPAKGATTLTHSIPLHSVVSIHAPAKGATAGAYATDSSSTFQSTRPRRARRLAPALVEGDRHVSIHAPAKGATLHHPLLIGQTE